MKKNKEFDKWLDEQIEEDNYDLYCDNGYAARAGFNAALEMVARNWCPEAWDVGDIEFDIAVELGYAKKYLKGLEAFDDEKD